MLLGYSVVLCAEALCVHQPLAEQHRIVDRVNELIAVSDEMKLGEIYD